MVIGNRRRHRIAISLALGPLLVLGLGGAGQAADSFELPEEARAPISLEGLRTRPDLPIRSIPLRGDFPDHPFGGVLGQRPPGKGGGCDKDVDLTSTLSGVVAVAAQDNGVCTSADLDTYVRGSSTFVVQAGGQEAAWTHTDVSDPANPVIVGQFKWSGGAGKNTYTPDLKTFSQGDNDYIVMGLERMAPRAFCGVVIVNVTDPANPVITKQFIGDGWCDTHNVFVENDPISGDGKYIYATADATNDLRVLSISGSSSVSFPAEIGQYTSPTANNDNYVHDVTVIDHGASVGRRVYLAYWDSGLVILNAFEVTPGVNPAPIVGPNAIDPPGFLVHHAWASQDGSRVFIQDEFLDSSGDEPVQMWDPAIPTKVDSLVLGTDVPANPAHNLEIRFDIAPNRLYVGWYKLGLQAWDFTPTGFVPSANSLSSTAVQYHQAQTEAADGAYDGAWGVRLESIDGNLYIFQSDRRFGLIIDCVGCIQTTGTITGTVTDSSNGLVILGAAVSSDTGESAPTDGNGDYTLADVPTGTRTVTASATGFVTSEKTADVTDGDTSVVNFALDPEPTGGSGTIKGTVTDVNTGAKLAGVLVKTDTGEMATTNKGGKYMLKDVPAGARTVTASTSDYLTEVDVPVTVAADTTTTLNFALAPEPD